MCRIYTSKIIDVTKKLEPVKVSAHRIRTVTLYLWSRWALNKALPNKSECSVLHILTSTSTTFIGRSFLFDGGLATHFTVDDRGIYRRQKNKFDSPEKGTD